MDVDQTPPTATNPSTTEDPKQQNNDNSNPQQGPGIVRHSAWVETPSHPHSGSFTTLKIPPTEKDTRKLFVGGLPPDVTGEEFRLYFEQFGKVMDSVIMFDRETRRSRGFGFVTFEDPESSARVLSMGNEQNVHQQDKNTNNDPPVARLEMRGKKIDAKAAEPKETSQRRYDEHHGRSRGRPPFPSPMNPSMMMMMYGPNDPNLYYNYNAMGQYCAPYSYAPSFVGYMASMYYPEQVPQYYPPVMPMVEGYPQYPPMDAAYGYASVPFAMPPIYEQPYDSTPVMQPMAPEISAEEGGVEVEGSTVVTQ